MPKKRGKKLYMLPEIFKRPFQPFMPVYFWLPTQYLFRLCDVRLALLRIIGREWPEYQLRCASGQFDHLLGQFELRQLLWIASLEYGVEVCVDYGMAL